MGRTIEQGPAPLKIYPDPVCCVFVSIDVTCIRPVRINVSRGFNLSINAHKGPPRIERLTGCVQRTRFSPPGFLAASREKTLLEFAECVAPRPNAAVPIDKTVVDGSNEVYLSGYKNPPCLKACSHSTKLEGSR